LIFLTGVTGRVGRDLAKVLSFRGVKMKGLIRDGDQAEKLKLIGPKPVVGDLKNKESLEPHFGLIEKAFLISSPASETEKLEGNFIDVAQKAGVKKIVKLSVMNAGVDAPTEIQRVHGRVEEKLKESGMSWVILRPGYFMQNFIELAPCIKENSFFSLPFGTAEINMVDIRDINLVAATALLYPGHENVIYEIRGGAAFSMEGAASIISRILRKEIIFKDISVDEFKNILLGKGLCEVNAGNLAEFYEYLKRGEDQIQSSVIKQYAAKEPTSFTEFLDDVKDLFI